MHCDWSYIHIYNIYMYWRNEVDNDQVIFCERKQTVRRLNIKSMHTAQCTHSAAHVHLNYIRIERKRLMANNMTCLHVLMPLALRATFLPSNKFPFDEHITSKIRWTINCKLLTKCSCFVQLVNSYEVLSQRASANEKWPRKTCAKNKINFLNKHMRLIHSFVIHVLLSCVSTKQTADN